MGRIGTFGSFTQARLAIYASQTGLRVTGNNIANINTKGYTRQVLDLESFRTGGADRYQSQYDVRVGNGVLTTGVSQLRDPYLDIRYRNEIASVGFMDTKLGGLEQIQAVLDEVGDGEDAFGIIEAQLSSLYDAFQQLTDQTNSSENDRLVRANAQALCKQLNSYASRLKEVHENMVSSYTESIQSVNSILGNIRELNELIRKNELHGDNALELRDERNVLIDELAQHMKIDVIYTEEDVGAGQTVEKLIIKLGNANPQTTDNESDCSTLVDGIYATQLYYPKANTNNALVDDKGNVYQYVDADGKGTNDPAKALQEFDPYYSLTLGALKDGNGRIMRTQNVTLKTVDVLGTDSTVDDGNGTITAIRYFSKETTTPATPASVKGAIQDRAAWSADLDTAAIATAIENMVNGGNTNIGDVAAVRLSYENGVLKLLADGQEVGTSGTVTFSDTDAATYEIKLADGTVLGSVTVAAGATADDMPSNAGDLTYHAAKPATTTTTNYMETTRVTYSTPVDLDDNDIYGALQAQRELLTEAGEFTALDTIANVDENAATKRGIPYYQNALDLLAYQIATAFNKQNQGYMVDEHGNYVNIKDNGDGTDTVTPLSFEYTENGETLTYTLNKYDDWADIPQAVKDQMNGATSVEAYLAMDDGNGATNGTFKGCNLFSVRSDLNDTVDPITGEGINASNITVSADWLKGPSVVSTFIRPTALDEATTDSSNIEMMVHLFTKKLEYIPKDVAIGATDTPMFNGSFQEMWVDIGTTLGDDMNVTGTMLDTHYASSVSLDTSRDSVSSVDLNDEAMNLMQYQKSYQAACRLMTTIDSVLDKLINGTGVTV